MLAAAIFWTSLAGLLLAYVLYAPLLALIRLARGAPPPPRLLVHQPPVTLVVPMHDEERCVDAKMRNCLALDYPAEKLEVLVVDDASRDATAARVLAWRAQFARRGVALRLERRAPGPGDKTQALNLGAAKARADIVAFSDADSLLAPRALALLVHAFHRPEIGCVGGRYVPGGAASGAGFYWRTENLLRRLESDCAGLLGASGALFALRRELFRPLAPGLINDDFILPMRVAEQGFRSVFEPDAVGVEIGARSGGGEFARRVRINVGNWQHLALFPAFFARPRLWGLAAQLFCHKFLRLLSPFFLIGLLLSSIALLPATSGVAGVALRLLLAAQTFCWTLAWLAQRDAQPAPRAAEAARYFAMINAAALAGARHAVFTRRPVAWNPARGETPENEEPGTQNLTQAAGVPKSGE